MQKVVRFGSRRRAALVLAAASTFLTTTSRTFAVDGSWIVDANGSWTTPGNWSPAVPSGGGTALFPLLSNSTSGHTVTLDTSSLSVSTITFNTPFTFTLNGANTLQGVTTINATDGVRDTPSFFSPGHTIGFNLAGNSGLTKTGFASVQLTGTNTFTGDVTVLSGALYLTNNNDAALGAANNAVVLTSGSLVGNVATLANTATSGSFTTARPMTAIGNTEIRNFAAMNWNGNIMGSGTLTHRGNGLGGGSLTLSANNSFNGAWILRDNDTVKLTGANGALTQVGTFTLNGTLALDNFAAANSNRISNGTVLNSNGGQLQLVGNATTAVAETVGQTNLNGGMSQISVVGNSTNTSLTLSSLVRNNRGTAFIHGDNLGTGNGATNTNVFLQSNVPTLVGGGGLAGSTNVSIVPWIIGNNDSTTNLNTSANSFMTYGANGFRPLNTATEYASTLAAGQNVRLTAATTSNSAVNINSLVLTGFNLDGAGTISVDSGAVLNVGQGTTVSAPISFSNTSEAVLHMTSSGTFSGVISGIGGTTLVKSGFNGLTLKGTNTYSGTTVLLAGTTYIGANVLPNAPGPFGNSNANVQMNGGSGASAGLTRLYATSFTGTAGTIGFGRAIDINNVTPDSTVAIGTAPGTGETFIVNGGINLLGGTLRFEGDPITSTGKTSLIISSIGGNGGVTDAFGSSQIMTGNNGYSGGTNIVAGTYLVNSNNAIGTGSVMFSNTALPTVANPLPGAIGAVNAPRTIFNPLLINALGASDGAGYLGMVVTGSQPITFSGAVDLNGKQRTIYAANTADTTFTNTLSRGGLDKQGPGRVILAGTNTYTGNTLVEAGTLSFAASQSNSNLIVSAGANANLTAGGSKYLKLRSLDLGAAASPTGTLDLNDNDAIIGAATPRSTVVSYVKNARNNGQWNLPGLTSSSAKPVVGGPTVAPTGLVVISAAQYTSVNPAVNTSFDGVPLSGTETLVKYSWNGDVTLDGKIDANDYSRIDGGFVASQSNPNLVKEYFNGDFNFDGAIDANDYSLIDGAFTTQNGVLLRAVTYLTGGPVDPGDLGSIQTVIDHANEFGQVYVNSFLATNAPEPTSLGLVGVAAAGLFNRRRRRI